MEGYLKVSPEKLRATSSEFASEGTVVSSLTQQMMTIVTDLASGWEGEASTAYINKFKQLQDDINSINSMIQEHVADLDEMAANYETGEQKNMETAGALPGDIIKDLFSGAAAIGGNMYKGAKSESSNSENTSNRDYSGWGIKDESVRNVEYAYLCKFANDASSGKNPSEMEKSFREAIERDLPGDHPLQKLKDKVKAYKKDGMDAFVIEIDSDHAIVVFGGTNGFIDGVNDAGIVANSGAIKLDPLNMLAGGQMRAANDLIKKLPYKDIKVTGHSLGGHVAADVTLNNEKISKCTTFDPPGRGDTWARTNWDPGDRVSKITNYVVGGSPVSSVGKQIGKTVRKNVHENYDAVFKNHDINHIINEAFGGIERVKNE